MSEHAQLLRIKKLKGGGIITAAARHNLREIQAEQGANSHIDSTRTYLNIVLRGADNAEGVASLAVQEMKQAKSKRRKDEVLGLEVLISLRVDSGIDETAFFKAALNWTEEFFNIPILSATIHNDETAPHCHIIMLPLFNGRMIGGKLMGNRARLLEIQADFFERVAQQYGLAKQMPRKRFSSVERGTAAAMVIDYVSANPRCLNEPTIRDALRDALTDNPMPAMAALCLNLPETKRLKPKTFASYMTKQCKPEKSIDFVSAASM
jgi:Plasmid recombination enzyme